MPYDKRSLKLVLKLSLKKSGISKPVTFIGCDTVMLRTFWEMKQIYTTVRNYLVIRVVKQVKFIHMLALGIHNKFALRLMICKSISIFINVTESKQIQQIDDCLNCFW
jgi:hypothetical protein